MTIPQEEVAQIVDHHLEWVGTMRGHWLRLASAYRGDWWVGHDGTSRNAATRPIRADKVDVDHSKLDIKTQVNFIEPWVGGFIDGLYYRGIRWSVKPDELVTHDERLSFEGPDKENPQALPQGMRDLLNRWYETNGMAQFAESAYMHGLLFEGGGAYKVGMRNLEEMNPGANPLDMVWGEAVPPWQAVYDRRAPSVDRLRYMGHYYQLPVEDVRERFGDFDSDVQPGALDEVIDKGIGRHQELNADKSYLRILEFYDMTTRKKRKVKVVDQRTGKEVSRDVIVRGEVRVYIVDDAARQPNVQLIASEALPWEHADGQPRSALVPIILEPDPEFPLKALAGAKNLYELNSEYNLAMSVFATAWRRDSARILLYLKNHGVDQAVLDSIANGGDLTLVGINGTTVRNMFEVLDMGTVSDTIVGYLDFLRDAIDRTQVTSSLTRGTPGGRGQTPLSATETSELVNYTETTLGRFRRRMDVALAAMAQLVLQALDVAMDAMGVPSLRWRVDGEPLDMPREALTRRWRLQVIDAASTPAARAAQLADFLGILPTLLELGERIQASPAGPARELAILALRRIVDLAELPDEFAPPLLQLPAPAPVVPDQEGGGAPAALAQGGQPALPIGPVV